MADLLAKDSKSYDLGTLDKISYEWYRRTMPDFFGCKAIAIARLRLWLTSRGYDEALCEIWIRSAAQGLVDMRTGLFYGKYDDGSTGQKILGVLCQYGHASSLSSQHSFRYASCLSCCQCALERASTPERREELERWRKTPRGRESKARTVLKNKEIYRERKNAKRRTEDGRRKKAEYMRRPDQRIKSNARQRQKKYKDLKNQLRREKIAKDPNFAIEQTLRRRLCKAFQMFTETGKIMNSRSYGIDYNSIIAHLGPCPGL